jgi:Ca2+-binding RTX toxin-like protein
MANIETKEVQNTEQTVENNKETTQVSTENQVETASDTVVTTDDTTPVNGLNLAELPENTPIPAPAPTVITDSATGGAAFTAFDVQDLRLAVESPALTEGQSATKLDELTTVTQQAPADFARGNIFLDNTTAPVSTPVVNQPLTETPAPVVRDDAAIRAAEQATRDIEARIARDAAEREAALVRANAEAERIASERAAAEEAARIAAERAAAEEAARIAAERAAAEEAARIAAERAAAEEAARIEAERIAAEEAEKKVLDQADNIWFGSEGNDKFTDPNGVFGAHGGRGNDKIDVTFAKEWDNDKNAGNGARSDGKISGGHGDDVIDITINNSKFFLNIRADDLKADDKLDGNDVVSLHGDYANAIVSLGGGDDQFFGGKGADNVTAGNGNDILLGGRGNDNLNGGNGNDTIQGGMGNDSLTGGAGKDRFVWVKEDLSATNIDSVTDFNTKQDSLDFSDILQGYSDGEIEELVRIVEIKAMRLTDTTTTLQLQMHEKVTGVESKSDWTAVANFSKLNMESAGAILKTIIATSHEA